MTAWIPSRHGWASGLSAGAPLEFEQPAAVRIQSLAFGIDVGAEDYADATQEKCRRDGLLVSTEGSAVLLTLLLPSVRSKIVH